MFLLWHPWLTTTNLSYSFPLLETSATASCGTTGIFNVYSLAVDLLWLHIWGYSNVRKLAPSTPCREQRRVTPDMAGASRWWIKTTRSNYAFRRNFRFTRVWKPSQKPNVSISLRFGPMLSNCYRISPPETCICAGEVIQHERFRYVLLESSYQGSCRTIQLTEMIEPVWFPQLFMTMFCVLPELLK